MGVDRQFWPGKSVLVTGHTGFKGSWLSLWLANMGARVTGYALDPPTEPSLFDAARVSDVLAGDVRADVRDRSRLAAAIAQARPDVVVHMAAQSLVLEGYADPLGTYETNVMGTANLLKGAFDCDSVRAVISVASDKCYENRERVHPYRETDRLGGEDPYSSSKACAEMLTASFCASLPRSARVASVRAGNVIGGGDWAEDRLVPDCIRAFSSGVPVALRRPQSIRPWQFVLEPLAGYLMLAERLAGPEGAGLEGGWNFGPLAGAEVPARRVAEQLAAAWDGDAKIQDSPNASAVREASVLRLDSTKARVGLGWEPKLAGEECIEWTARWYDAWHRRQDMVRITTDQIESYMELA